MSEYTEQDAELIIGAVMVNASRVERDTPTLRNQIETTVKLILDGVVNSSSHDPYALDLVSVARLMREAREQGAAEMRERIATRLRAFGDPDICGVVRDMPLTLDKHESAAQLHKLQRQLSDAGNRHDWDECNRLDAEIAAIERIDE